MFYSSLDSSHRDESNDSKSFRSEQYSSRYYKFTDLSNSRPVWPVLTRYPTRPDPLGALAEAEERNEKCFEKINETLDILSRLITEINQIGNW